MKKKAMTVYLVLALALCLVPFAGLLWKKSGESLENRTLASFPSIRTEDGGWNVQFLSQAGDYFEDHFAYRQEMVTADALLKASLLGVSTADGVIKGTDGWLYYKDSLDDYLVQNTLSDRAIFNIAHTLAMMQGIVEESGRQFLFTVAPNKNSLYGEHMPYYDRAKVGEVKNIAKLQEALAQEGVHYVNLHALFEGQDEVLYHQRDSHWNNKGAALAAQALLDALDREHASYEDAPFEIRKDYEGDLDKMLFPLAVTPEDEIYYTDAFTYQYEGEVESNFDPDIRTTCADAKGSLLMYRDSFGNALLPFFAQEYEKARFSRGIPYYLDDMIFCGADTVLVERAERFLPDMAMDPPTAQAPRVQISLADAKDRSADEGLADCEAQTQGMYVQLKGTVDPSLVGDRAKIYLRTDGETIYEAFPMTTESDGEKTDCGYVVYIQKERLLDNDLKIELFLASDEETVKVYDSKVSFEFQGGIAG